MAICEEPTSEPITIPLKDIGDDLDTSSADDDDSLDPAEFDDSLGGTTTQTENPLLKQEPGPDQPFDRPEGRVVDGPYSVEHDQAPETD